MVEEEKLEVPQKYFDLLPESIKYAESNNILLQIKNSLLWLFYLYDLPKEERDRIIQELLRIDYQARLNLYPGLDPVGVFLYFQTGYENIISSIRRILKRLDQYKITHPGLIATSLYSAWVQPYTINENEYKLLVEIVRNPKGSFREWSKNTKLSLAGVKYAFDRLKKKMFLRIYSMVNFNAIKLKHYLIHISRIHNDRLRNLIKDAFLKNLWCRSVSWFASDPSSLFISLTIPSHTRCIKTVLDNMKVFRDFGEVNIYEINERFSSYNLTAYDPRTGWNFSSNTWIMFSFSETLESCLDYLKQINFVHRLTYTNLPGFRLSKGDLYIIAGLARDYRLKITMLSEITGYSLSTISKKKRELVEKKILYPVTFIANIGLSSSLALLWEKSSEDLEYLIYASAELPYVVGYKMKKIYPTTSGDYLLLFIWLPGKVSWDFIQNFSELGKEIGLKEVFYEYMGPSSFTIDRFIHRWDEDRCVWRWSRDDFKFI